MTSYYDINKSNMTDMKSSTMGMGQNKQCLNYALFLESIFVSAISFKFNDKFTDVDKVCIFLFYLFFFSFCIWWKE